MNRKLTLVLSISMLLLLVLTPNLSAQVPAASLAGDPYWGIFVQCKTIKNGEYRVVMGYLWEGTEDLTLDRSDLNKSGISGSLPTTFKPGRHTFTLKTTHDQFVWTVSALGRTKTSTFGAPNVSECPYWGIFTQCKTEKNGQYHVVMGYVWEGTQDLVLERSNLNKSGVSGNLPQTFKPGRHTFTLKTTHEQFVWTVSALGKTKTTTFGAPNVGECPYWGIFVDCVLPDDTGYKVRFGYKWDGDQPLVLERSSLNRQGAVTGTVPQVFEPGRHTFDIYVNDLNNIVWTVNAQGKGKTSTGSPNYQTICESPTPEPTPVTGGYNTAIGDRVWLDENGNGIQETGEANVPDVTVTLLDDAGSELGQRVTGPTGFYIFTGLMAGRYQLRFDLPEGYEFTLTGQGGDEYLDSDVDQDGLTSTFTVGDDTIDYRWDAGLVAVSGQLPPEGRTVLALPLVILGD